jgi:hypothetical protein
VFPLVAIVFLHLDKTISGAPLTNILTVSYLFGSETAVTIRFLEELKGTDASILSIFSKIRS